MKQPHTDTITLIAFGTGFGNYSNADTFLLKCLIPLSVFGCSTGEKESILAYASIKGGGLMSRKSQYINAINNRDIQSFRLLFYAHHVPRSLMRASDSRLRSYEKQGLVEKCVSIGTGEAVYKCTDKGRAFIGKLDGFAGHKPYLNSNSSEHNCLLAQQIASLPDNLQAGWYSERDLWGMYQDRLDEIRQNDYDRWEELSRVNTSAVDGGVVVGGELVLVEIISEHYNSIAIESKENFATVLGTGVHYFHT